jgi:hypothetical protein
MKRFLFVLTLLFLGMLNSWAQYSWSVFRYASDLYMCELLSGKPAYNLRIGGGGCIESICRVSDYKELIGAEYSTQPKNHTDAVIQFASTAQNIKAWVTAAWPSGENLTAWNQNQAGDLYDRFSATSVVRYSPSLSTLEIYSKMDEVLPEATRFFGGETPIYTRYTMLPGGILRIRQVEIVPTVSVYYPSLGTTLIATAANWWHGGWFPFCSTQFPSMWPIYDGQNVMSATTPGWAMVWGGIGATAIGIVFGTQAPVANGPVGNVYSVYGSQHWEKTAVMGSSVLADACQPGTVIDTETDLVISDTYQQTMKSCVASLSTIPRSQIYAPGQILPSDLDQIVSNLENQIDGIRTNHMAALVK